MRNQNAVQQPKKYINSLIIFYLLLPFAYLGYVMFSLGQTNSNYYTFLYSDPLNSILLLSVMICFIWAYILWKLKELNQYKTLPSYLMCMAVSQLFIGNIIGVVFTVITRIKTKKFPSNTNVQKGELQCKFLSILNIILTLIVVSAFIRISF
ncbi:hypothetical protein [Oceanobacillus sp. FSL W7-1293]|uniref:hypothetical protein n=1 Tax=Oceanobacillus sp. FSL W7-1293 TaxID=2921699 RepID=UPI0030D37465